MHGVLFVFVLKIKKFSFDWYNFCWFSIVFERFYWLSNCRFYKICHFLTHFSPVSVWPARGCASAIGNSAFSDEFSVDFKRAKLRWNFWKFRNRFLVYFKWFFRFFDVFFGFNKILRFFWYIFCWEIIILKVIKKLKFKIFKKLKNWNWKKICF